MSIPDDQLHPARRADPNRKRPKASRRDVDILLEKAWEQGCDIRIAGNGHFKIYMPNGEDLISMPATPSGYRTLRNKRGQLRRAGLKL
jgi:hypothetical protein